MQSRGNKKQFLTTLDKVVGGIAWIQEVEELHEKEDVDKLIATRVIYNIRAVASLLCSDWLPKPFKHQCTIE